MKDTTEMHLEFDIPVPETCAECRIGYVMSKRGYNGWIISCLADPSISIPAGEGVKRRDERCPGIIREDKNAK